MRAEHVSVAAVHHLPRWEYVRFKRVAKDYLMQFSVPSDGEQEDGVEDED